ncbi:MAG: hypothetical protein E7354_05200 [Clostridiales bacterium]|nr:hypothetical protein [Clostridiales bacterium]
MNPKLIELFNVYRMLRSVQDIVQEILVIDYYANNYSDQEAINLIDYFLTKYNKEIKQISGLYKNKTVIEDDPEIYDKKDSDEINDDLCFIRDCLVIIGAVQSGIRPNFETVVAEVEEQD